MFILSFHYTDFKKWLNVSLFLVLGTLSAFANGKENSSLALTCPNNFIINPIPGECYGNVDFQSLQWSSTFEIVDTAFSHGPTYNFPYGVTTITLTVTSTSGTMESCDFDVFVQQFETQPVCNPEQLLYITDGCSLQVTADMILTGGPYGCNDGYSVSITSFTGEMLGDTIYPEYVGAQYNVLVSDIFSNLLCNGVIIPQADSLPQSITCPPDITLGCHLPTGPAVTGYPAVSSCFENDEMEFEFQDQKTNSFCDGDNIAFEIVRNWNVTDPYGNESSCTQNISARRLSLTEIIFPPNYDGSDFPPFACSDTLNLMEVSDTSITGYPKVNGFSPHFSPCNLAISFTDSITNICGNAYSIERTWLALDYCEDESRHHVQYITVEDTEAPQFTVPDTLLVSTNNACSSLATFPPITLIEECSFFQVSIQTPWGIINGNGGTIQVSQTPGFHEITYTVMDACNNGSAATTILHIQEEVIATCPPTMSISSEYYLENILPALDTGNLEVLEEFGYPEFSINCNFSISEDLSYDIDDCTEGNLFRNFAVFGLLAGCSQTIQIHHVSDFVVQFPPNISIDCGPDPADFGEPVITGENAENIEVSYTDLVFTNVPDACFEISRTWLVKNACVTGGVDDNEVEEVPESELGLPFPECDLDGDGDCDSLTYRDSWSATMMPGEEDAEQFLNPDTDLDSDPWDGYITHIQTITVSDTIAPVLMDCSIPDICITDNDCATTVNLPTPEALDCQEDLTFSAVSDFGIGFGPFDDFTAGTYEVTFFAVDNCNNQSLCFTSVNIVDCTPPTPVCQTQEILTIQPGTPPSVAVFASELNNGSSDNCPGGMQFSFSQDTVDLSRVFFCDDLGQQTLELWVTDLAGNQAFCDIFLLIEEPSPGFCGGPPTMSLSGNISTEIDQGINAVEVTSTQGFSSSTNSSGNYNIGVNDQGNDLMLVPFLDSNPMNGVTTFDALLVVKHVLGNGPLDSPYKIIAADVNGSNSVTTFDAVVIRQLILGVISEFTPDSWRFIPADFEFPNPSDPFGGPFQEFITLPVPPPATGHDFIGLKVGDLNNTASPFFHEDDIEIEERNLDKSVNFSLSDTYVNIGQEIKVPIYMPETALNGFQFALGFDTKKLALVDVQAGILDEFSFGKKGIKEGILKTSWYTALPKKYSASTPAFTLHFKPKESGDLSNMIWLEETALAAEAYSPALEIVNIELDFTTKIQAQKTFQLHPNRPDPFKASTIIPFDLPKAGPVELRIFNTAGKQVKYLQHHFAEGHHELEVQGNDLPGTGVFFFQIQTDSNIAEGKMVKY